MGIGRKLKMSKDDNERKNVLIFFWFVFGFGWGFAFSPLVRGLWFHLLVLWLVIGLVIVMLIAIVLGENKKRADNNVAYT